MACLPASSLTSVWYSLLSYWNLIYGSYFPKVSASFKNDASRIMTLSIDFLSKNSDFVGGAYSTHLNEVVNWTVPVFLFLPSNNVSSCLQSPSKSVNVYKEIGDVDPRKSADIASYSMASNTKLA